MHARRTAALRRIAPSLRHRLTIRVRLAISYAALIIGSGAILITLVYLYMRFVPNYQIVGTAPPETTPPPDHDDAGVAQPTDGVAIQNADDFLRNLLIASLVALLVLVGLAGVVGWLVAGRIVRPLAHIADAARIAAAGNLDHRIGIAGPNDEIRDLADTFDMMLVSLERSFATQKRFAANASHELQTPLATTQTMIDVTLADPDATTNQLRALAHRIREVNRSSIETVDALLDLANVDYTINKSENIDLRLATLGVLRELLPEAEGSNIRVLSPLDSAIATGNPVLIRQAISNLIRNAIRHNIPGGEVAITTTQTDTQAVLTITNTGRHVTNEEVATLAEPFARGQHRGLTRGAGHGLGLAIVEAIATAHRGNLSLRARPGGGLTATLTLLSPNRPARS